MMMCRLTIYMTEPDLTETSLELPDFLNPVSDGELYSEEPPPQALKDKRSYQNG